MTDTFWRGGLFVSRAICCNLSRHTESKDRCKVNSFMLFFRGISRADRTALQEYWATHDESGEYPHELHAALAKDGWIGIALPEELGGSGLGISEATMMLQTISESVYKTACT